MLDGNDYSALSIPAAGATLTVNEHGTYAVGTGTIHLAFADGSVRDEPFAVLTNDADLQPNLVGEGVMLGEDNFYPDTE